MSSKLNILNSRVNDFLDELNHSMRKEIEDNSKFLIWKENDRAIATFKNITDIENAETNLREIVKKMDNSNKIKTTNG